MTNTKMTYVDALNAAIAALTDQPEVVEKLTALRDQTAKRNAAKSDKPTKAQVQNMELAEVVREVLRDAGKALTVTEIMQSDERLSGLSNQKVTAVIRSMGEAITKVPDKRVNRFTLA